MTHPIVLQVKSGQSSFDEAVTHTLSRIFAYVQGREATLVEQLGYDVRAEVLYPDQIDAGDIVYVVDESNEDKPQAYVGSAINLRDRTPDGHYYKGMTLLVNGRYQVIPFGADTRILILLRPSKELP